MNHFSTRFLVNALLAIVSIAYGLVVLWYVPTQPTVPIGCLLVNSDRLANDGLEIRKIETGEYWKGDVPEVGDQILELSGRPLRSFTDWARVHREWRNLQIGSDGTIEAGQDPSEESNSGDLAVVQYPDKSRFVKFSFIRAGESKTRTSWVKLVSQPVSGVSLALIWFILQLFIVVIGGVAYWSRPFDQPVRTFFALSSLTLCAFLGGSHWWVIASSPMLILMFTTTAVLLPAVLLKFFIVYPYPPLFYQRSRLLTLLAIYAMPIFFAVGLGTSIILSWILTMDYGVGPFSVTLERLLSEQAGRLMPTIRFLAHLSMATAMFYFALCITLLIRSVRSVRSDLEQNQVKFILWAALGATVPVFFTAYLFFFRTVDFALGAARLPMFLASLAFMLAYAIGIAKYKLLLIDQVVSRGVWYYGLSVALSLLFSALIAVGAVTALHQDLSIFGQTIPLVLVLTTSVLVLIWGRDTIQRVLDRNFFSEKYQFDKALGRMNRVVAGTLEPEAVSEGLLTSCRDVLQAEEAALYLRKRGQPDFRMLISSGRTSFPRQVKLDDDMIAELELDRVWQKVSQSSRPIQRMIREINAEVVHGLEIHGQLAGILVLGAKPAHKSYSAEDVAFVTSMARVASIALQCAIVQQDVSKLKQDVELKIDKIADQERQITSLQNELSAMGTPTQTITDDQTFHRAGIIGTGSSIAQVLDTVRKVAATESSVLIRGESGTGKELLARAVHENSTRSDGPLVSVHCGALSPTLLESELFGHVKGAFTDARDDKMGRFQLADGGTLFLDEIGDISLEVQIKLLRVLQERIIEPVGGTNSVKVDVRVVAATHRNIERLIATGQFREDLFYRLNVISLTLPPLRERRDDIYELSRHFLKIAASKVSKKVIGFHDDVLQVFAQYSWPGNIRELQNVVERAVVLAEDGIVQLRDLPNELTSPVHPSSVKSIPQGELPTRVVPVTSVARKIGSSEDSEQERLREALAACDGNKAEAARMLGMPRSTFFSKLKKHEIS